MNIVEFDEKCKKCDGTGLYAGMAERDGAAIVCHNCDGTGCHHVKFEYEDFEGRQKHETAKRVYATNPGICVGEGNGHKLEDFGGLTLGEWEAGKDFTGVENRKYTCPAWWYQIADYKKKPEWKKCLGWGAFSNCDHFPDKANCWAQWDKEF